MARVGADKRARNGVTSGDVTRAFDAWTTRADDARARTTGTAVGVCMCMRVRIMARARGPRGAVCGGAWCDVGWRLDEPGALRRAREVK